MPKGNEKVGEKAAMMGNEKVELKDNSKVDDKAALKVDERAGSLGQQLAKNNEIIYNIDICYLLIYLGENLLYDQSIDKINLYIQ